MARVDEIPIDSCTTAGTLADICESALCCSSAYETLSDHYPHIVAMLATRKPNIQQTRILSRRFSTYSGRRTVSSSLALLSVLTGNVEFNDHVPEFFRPFGPNNGKSFDPKVFKEVVRGRTSLQRFGFVKNCLADELAISELSTIVMENLKSVRSYELNSTAVEIMRLN